MFVTCSRCGKSETFLWTAGAARRKAVEGWGSRGVALYCPDCARLWDPAKDGRLDSRAATIKRIQERKER